MLLPDTHIRTAISTGRVSISPFDPGVVQPASIDVRLARHFRVFDPHAHTHIDPAAEQPGLTRAVEVKPDEPFILHPGQFALASTLESVTLADDLAARFEGKSSLGRLGLLTHATAGFIDPGFTGHVTMELACVAPVPIKLWPGMKVGQLCLFQMAGPAEYPYGSAECGSRYQGQVGPTASRSHIGFHRAQV